MYGVSIFEATGDAWVRWRSRQLSVTPIDRINDGTRVKIVGRVDAAAPPLEAPITGRACVAWSVEVQEAPGWESVLQAQEAQALLVRDGSGRPAMVHATRARVLIDTDETSWPLVPTARMRAFLQRHGVRERGNYGSVRPYRYCEAAIEPGATITVVGVARLEVDTTGIAGSYREPPLRARFAAEARTPLWILNGSNR